MRDLLTVFREVWNRCRRPIPCTLHTVIEGGRRPYVCPSCGECYVCKHALLWLAGHPRGYVWKCPR